MYVECNLYVLLGPPFVSAIYWKQVYGDVWRWLGDSKVGSLREKVVEAQFSYVHVDSLAKKAHAIAQVRHLPRLLFLYQMGRTSSMNWH